MSHPLGSQSHQQAADRIGPLVLTLLLIVGALAFPSFLEAQRQSKIIRCKRQLKKLATSLETYASNHNGAYPTRLENCGPCRYTYQVRRDPDTFTIVCRSGDHPDYSTECLLIDHP
ncbi:hypothetical protein ABS71_12870 [bacterium SCN 62-11]|mgnify:CR=1 FL=1|nr:type II secretion system protein [Candidatus Eremiobacteraeota bacterium]ODT64697.1 MAG: hypothetical protein ABS71_12870 [bacterium SCN 62-11]